MVASLYPELVDHARALESSASLTELMDTAGRVFADFGVEYFSFINIPKTPADIQNAVLAARFPQELARTYSDRQWFTIDASMRFLPRATLPFRPDETPDYALLKLPARELRESVVKFGIAEELYIPVIAPAGICGAVWCGGRELAIEGPRKWALYLLACHAFEYVRNRIGPSDSSCQLLTPREREVVTWTALGKTAWEIGEILNITVRTVNEYAQAARKKLGATNRAHAVAIAMRDHLIEL